MFSINGFYYYWHFFLIITGCPNNDNKILEAFLFDEKTFMSNWNAWNEQKIVHIGYGSMHYITSYGKTYDYKIGHEVSENGLSYGVSDFQIIEHGGE